jgi:UDP-N-acetylmuramate--alanine ligase
LAQIMKNMGFNIQGSDLNLNSNIERLVKKRIKVFIGHNKKNINKATMIVISSAIKNKNSEILASKKKKLPIFKRGEMLANIVSLKKNIVVAGSHGKTTTTSMISNILEKAKLDPTVINGGIINSLKNTARLGKGEWAVIESDESDGSFLNLPITYSILTNVDKEHLDYYKNFNTLKKNFVKFIDKTPSFGKSLICLDNQHLKEIIKKCKTKNYLTYGFDKNSNYQIINVRKNKSHSLFDLKIKIFGKVNAVIKNIKIKLLGDHNITNAAAAFAVTLNLGININIIKKSLSSFTGIQRRFTKIFSIEKREFYDDYAHHPTEIEAVLKGVREVNPKRKIISIFQPHRYSRIKLLKKEFSKSFKLSDLVVLCPVYSAGEKATHNFSQEKFAKLISDNSNTQVVNIQNQQNLKNFFKQNLFDDELIICMGAGSISNWIRNISKEL